MYLILILSIPTMTSAIPPSTINNRKHSNVSRDNEGENYSKLSTKKTVHRYCTSYVCTYKSYHPCCATNHKKKIGNQTDNLFDRLKTRIEFAHLEGPKKLPKKMMIKKRVKAKSKKNNLETKQENLFKRIRKRKSGAAIQRKPSMRINLPSNVICRVIKCNDQENNKSYPDNLSHKSKFKQKQAESMITRIEKRFKVSPTPDRDSKSNNSTLKKEDEYNNDKVRKKNVHNISISQKFMDHSILAKNDKRKSVDQKYHHKKRKRHHSFNHKNIYKAHGKKGNISASERSHNLKTNNLSTDKASRANIFHNTPVKQISSANSLVASYLDHPHTIIQPLGKPFTVQQLMDRMSNMKEEKMGGNNERRTAHSREVYVSTSNKTIKERKRQRSHNFKAMKSSEKEKPLPKNEKSNRLSLPNSKTQKPYKSFIVNSINKKPDMVNITSIPIENIQPEQRTDSGTHAAREKVENNKIEEVLSLQSSPEVEPVTEILFSNKTSPDPHLSLSNQLPRVEKSIQLSLPSSKKQKTSKSLKVNSVNRKQNILSITTIPIVNTKPEQRTDSRTNDVKEKVKNDKIKEILPLQSLTEVEPVTEILFSNKTSPVPHLLLSNKLPRAEKSIQLHLPSSRKQKTFKSLIGKSVNRKQNILSTKAKPKEDMEPGKTTDIGTNAAGEKVKNNKDENVFTLQSLTEVEPVITEVLFPNKTRPLPNMSLYEEQSVPVPEQHRRRPLKGTLSHGEDHHHHKPPQQKEYQVAGKEIPPLGQSKQELQNNKHIFLALPPPYSLPGDILGLNQIIPRVAFTCFRFDCQSAPGHQCCGHSSYE